jgi:hypothetical protein
MAIQRFEMTSPNEVSRYRVVRCDTCSELPGTVVRADVLTGEVIMREEGWDRLLDHDGNPKKDSSGGDMWVGRTRKYQFPPGSIKIIPR